jgi:hypothetical protein
MSFRALVIVSLLQLVVFPVGAAELSPSFTTEGVWSSNVLKRTDDVESDFSFRVGPTLRLREAQGDLTYDMTYRFRYEQYAQLTDLNGFDTADQYFTGRGAWRVTPTTTLLVNDTFNYTTNITSLFDTTALVSTAAVGRERITTNNAQVGVTHQLGPLWELNASAGNVFYEYEDPRQSNTAATTGTLQLTRAFTRRLVAGVGTQYQRQDFDESDFNPTRGTTLYQAFGVLNYQFSRTWRLSARAGPAYVQPDAIETPDASVLSFYAVDPSTCPKRADGTPVIVQFPQSQADLCTAAFYRTPQGFIVARVQPSSTVTTVPFVGDQSASSSLNYFGTISMAKEWRQWRGSVDYSRSASNSSGLNGSSVLDQFTGTLRWTPSRLWRVNFNAIYSTQSALSKTRQREIALIPGVDTTTIPGTVAVVGIPFEVDVGEELTNQIDLTSVLFSISGSRRISRHLSIVGAASFWQQETTGLAEDTKVKDILISLGFTWNFDPISL